MSFLEILLSDFLKTPKSLSKEYPFELRIQDRFLRLKRFKEFLIQIVLYFELYPYISENSDRTPMQSDIGNRFAKIINSDQGLKLKATRVTASTLKKFFEEVGVELDLHASQPLVETPAVSTAIQNGSSLLRALKQPLSDSVLFNSGVSSGGTVKGLSTFCRHILFPLYLASYLT